MLAGATGSVNALWSRFGSGGSRHPREAAHFGYLRRERVGYAATDLIGCGECGVRVQETFDLNA